MHQYTFPQVAIEIMLALASGNKSPEYLAKSGGRTMAAVLKSLEELMIDDYCYKLPNSKFTLSRFGRSFIEEVNEAAAFQTTRDEIFDMRW